MVSLGQILILALILILVFGSRRLPVVARSLGEAIRDFKKALQGKSDIDVTHTVKRVDDEDKS